MSQNNDSLGDRMKSYEAQAESKLFTQLPIVCRLDGRAFHTFTRGFKRPYDERLSFTMRELTVKLMEETSALVGYTQSDEISLLLHPKSIDSQVYFNGRRDKILSVLASVCSVYFNQIFAGKVQWDGKLAFFDCRVFNAPSKIETYNYFLWRERDAVRNSLSMLAQHYFSHEKLQNKNSSDMHDMLHSVGVNWNDCPLFFKRGSYFKKVVSKGTLSIDEFDILPPLHNARKNPNLEIERSSVEEVLLNVNSISQVEDSHQFLFT